MGLELEPILGSSRERPAAGRSCCSVPGSVAELPTSTWKACVGPAGAGQVAGQPSVGFLDEQYL